MTIFTAFEPVTKNFVWEFFRFLAGNPFIIVKTSTEFKAYDDHGITIDMGGSGFAYVGGVPSGGTITSIQVIDGSFGLAYNLTKVSASAHKLLIDLELGHYTAARTLLLPGHDRITGSTGWDYLLDHGGHDRITGGPGNDYMTGGGGNDTFVFRVGFSVDKISNFIFGSVANHDIMELHSLPYLHSFAQLKAHEMLVGGDVVISDRAGDTITLLNIHSKTDLVSADFHFI
jgi:Ca2+-binding RTX toxin-like protein